MTWSKWPYILLGLAISFAVGGGVFVLTDPSFLAHLKPAPKVAVLKPSAIAQTSQTSDSPPTAINIPKINKNLPIKRATVHGNNWDMFGDAVAWLSTSALPGKGNVILYAHDWKTLWADLNQLKPGDTIEVMQNTIKTTYTVTESRAVEPTDVQSILSKSNRLTLYTCEGSFDQKRRVVYAEPSSSL